LNENYNYEPSRTFEDLPFTPTQYAQNFMRLRSFLYNMLLPDELLAEPVPADKGYILVTNRKDSRRVTNPEDLHKVRCELSELKMGNNSLAKVVSDSVSQEG
jgi:hypothetical protein